MTLNSKERKALKAKGHHLKPVIQIGQKGITDGVVAETLRALETHELIKVHVAGESRDDRSAAMEDLAQRAGAEMVDKIGKICLLYRQREDA